MGPQSQAVEISYLAFILEQCRFRDSRRQEACVEELSNKPATEPSGCRDTIILGRDSPPTVSWSCKELGNSVQVKQFASKSLWTGRQSKSPLKLKWQGDAQREFKKKIPTPPSIKHWILPSLEVKWAEPICEISSVAKRISCAFLSSHPITRSTAQLVAWWAVSVLRQLICRRGKEGRTQLPTNNLHFSWFSFLTYFSFVFSWGFLLFQD